MTEGAERVKPPVSGAEKPMLCAYLDYQRATLLRKLQGLSDEELRRIIVPSGWSLLGLVKHLARVESYWFEKVFAGGADRFPLDENDPNADFRIEPHESTTQIVTLYQEMVASARGIVDAASLDDKVRGETNRGPETTLRWIMLHMLEEVARHNGHADIVRELIDGSVGD